MSAGSCSCTHTPEFMLLHGKSTQEHNTLKSIGKIEKMACVQGCCAGGCSAGHLMNWFCSGVQQTAVRVFLIWTWCPLTATNQLKLLINFSSKV